MADLERLITDKFTINSAGKTPQQRRHDSIAMAFSSRMAPHAINFAEREKSTAGFHNKTGNEQNMNSFLTISGNIFGTKENTSRLPKDSFYKASSFFDTESNSELGDAGMEQSGLFGSENNFQFGDSRLGSEEFHSNDSGNLFNDANIEKTNVFYLRSHKSNHTKYRQEENKENNPFSNINADKTVKCSDSRSPLNEINHNIGVSGAVKKVNHFKTFVSRNIKIGSGVYDSIGSSAACKSADSVRVRRRSGAEVGSPLKRKTSCSAFAESADDGRTPSKFSVVLNSLSSLPGNVSTSSPYSATPSKSPPCKRRQSSTVDPCQLSLDSGFENSTTSNFERRLKSTPGSYPDNVRHRNVQQNFQDDMSESARHFDTAGTSRLMPENDDIIKSQNMSDYEFDTLHDLEEEFDLDSNRENSSVSKYEIISTDSPNILRVESSYASNTLEFGSPIGDCETSETFGSCRKPVTNYGRKMPVRTETTRMLNFDIDSSANSTFQFTPPPSKLPARHAVTPNMFDFRIRNKSASKSDSSFNFASKNETTPNKSGSPFSFGINNLADRYSFVDSGVPNWNDSPKSCSAAELDDFNHTKKSATKKTESVSIVPGSRRSRLFNSMSTNSIESNSCISEMEDCMLFDMDTNNCMDDNVDEGVDVNYAMPSSMGALISSEIKTWDSDEKNDGTPCRESLHTSMKRPPFRRCFSLTPETEASNAIERVRVTLFKSPVYSRCLSSTPSDFIRTAFKRPEPPTAGIVNNEGSAGKRRRKTSCFDLLAAHDENDTEASALNSNFSPMSVDTVDAACGVSSSALRKGGLVRSRPVLQRALSENCSMIKTALVDIESYNESNLIGDFSMPFILPLASSQHQDLKAINGNTLAMLIQGHYKDTIHNFEVIDCRYPYEFSGGHIVGAQNLFNEDLIRSKLLGLSSGNCAEVSDGSTSTTADANKRHILVFHCEFSLERGPKLCRFLRIVDRDLNRDSYPSLRHPEVYLLRGGYRSFHEMHGDLCRPTPGAYTSMLDPKHATSMKEHRAAAGKSKSSNRIGR